MTDAPFSLTVVRSVHYQDGPSWNHEINLYPYNTLYFVLDGDGCVRVGEKVTPLLPGYVYLIPAGTLYACWCESAIDKLYVEAYVETVPGMDVFSGLNEVRALPYSREKTRLLIARDTPALRDRMWLRGQLLTVLSRFVDERWQPPGREVLRFKPLLDDIAREPALARNLGEAARRHGWHPSALSRAFRRAYGCALKGYADLLTMNRLKQELLTTDRSLRDLAARYGFCDAYYLSAFFKKHQGASPSQYRASNRRLSGRSAP